MATAAGYLPVVGNFDPAAGFALVNSVGDAVPNVAPGPPRPGSRKMALIFQIGPTGPIGDDASFTLSIPYPYPGFTAQDLIDKFNSLVPTGSIIYTIAGSQVQEIVMNVVPNVATQTFNFVMTWGNPLAQDFGFIFTADFGHTITN